MNLLLQDLHWWSDGDDGLGDLRLRGRRLAALGSGLAGQRGERALRLEGRLALPGLINCHDHLDLDLLPHLGRPPYANVYEWAREIYRPTERPIRDLLRVDLADRLHWGGLRNLASGVCTVVHHDRYRRRWFGRGFPVRVLDRYGWAHSLEFGPDPQQAHRRCRGRPFLIHLAEGVDEVAAAELDRAEEIGLLGKGTVMVHGIALDPERHQRIIESGGSLIWCPASSLRLYGRGAAIDRLHGRLPIGLGTDSTISGSVTLLDELRTAAETGLVDPDDLLRMVTAGAAEIFDLDDGRGRLIEGGAGDLVVLRDGGSTPARSLLTATPADIELVTVAAEPRLASAEVAARLGLGAANTFLDGRPKWIYQPLDRLRRRTRETGGADLVAASRVWALFEPPARSAGDRHLT